MREYFSVHLWHKLLPRNLVTLFHILFACSDLLHIIILDYLNDLFVTYD